MKQPLVSIIATFYNSGDFVHSAIKTIQEQTYNSIEIICVNDGSTDETLKHLQQYAKNDERIIIINKENEGAVHLAFAEAQKKIKGDFVFTFDHDDLLSNDAIEMAVEAMEENPDWDMSLFRVKNIDDSGKINETKKQPTKVLTGKEAVKATVPKFLYSFRCFYKTKIFNSINFNRSENWIYYDEYLGRLLLTRCKKIGTNNGIYFYVSNPNSTTRTIKFRRIENLETHVLLMKKFLIDIDAYNDIKKEFEQSIFEKLNMYVDFYNKKILKNVKLSDEQKIYAKDLFKRCYNSIDKTYLINNAKGVEKAYLKLIFSSFTSYMLLRAIK